MIFLLDVMGLIIKHLSGGYGAAELSVYRNLFGLIPSMTVLAMSASWRAGGCRLGLRQWPLACLRGAFVAVAQFMFYLSLARLAFATATTIAFSMSLFAVALSVPILGDRVGWVRWAAVMVGFAGVAMVIGPGSDSFSRDALLPMGAATFYALTAVTARLFDEGVPTPLVNLYSTGAAALGAIVLCLSTGGFTPIAANSGLGGSGVLCLVVSFRMTEPSNLAPFNYFGILFAFALGWVFFGESPVERLFPGALLIVAGGLLIVWRERRVRKRAAAGGLRDL
jgi:drug/metabolite transporter (DMT)-like permease